jgi:hypothetical protein
MQKSPEERSYYHEDRGIMSQRLFIPQKPFDIKLTDYPLAKKEYINFFPALPTKDGYRQGPQTEQAPAKRRG